MTIFKLNVHNETFFLDLYCKKWYSYIEKVVKLVNKRIKEIRHSNKLSQEEFGKAIGSARNTIANYENGNRNPSN